MKRSDIEQPLIDSFDPSISWDESQLGPDDLMDKSRDDLTAGDIYIEDLDDL